MGGRNREERLGRRRKDLHLKGLPDELPKSVGLVYDSFERLASRPRLRERCLLLRFLKAEVRVRRAGRPCDGRVHLQGFQPRGHAGCRSDARRASQNLADVVENAGRRLRVDARLLESGVSVRARRP